MTIISATIRGDEKLDAIRTAGNIPAVVYGAGITTPLHVSVEREAFKKAWKAAGGSTTVTVTADGKNYDTLIHDFQIDPATDMVIHADFLALDKTTKVTVGVELEFVGVSPAVKSGTGTLEKMLHEIEVEGLPKDLPKSIEVDISSLENVHDQIHVRDLKISSGIEVKTDADEVIAVITGLNVEEESTETTEIDFASIEVEKKGKKEDEESAE
jgi:large subunit ribosomal protein L25